MTAIIIACLVIGLTHGWYFLDKQEKQRKYVAEQNAIHEELTDSCEQTLQLIHSLPTHIIEMEKCLTQANDYFVEHAFSLFWDEIENVEKHLESFYSQKKQINANAQQYSELSISYVGQPPAFPFEAVKNLNATDSSTASYKHMTALVGKAQRDFQFASMYEHRKTKQIVIDQYHDFVRSQEETQAQFAHSIYELQQSFLQWKKMKKSYENDDNRWNR
jgi:hypothetical protein